MTYSVRVETRSFQNHSGIRLDADVYTPEGDGPFPVLVMRQPYGRAIASTVVYAHPRWYAAHGYIVVIQDVAGRGSSSGDFEPFGSQEIADGYDTVQWAAHLPKSDGQVGMYGFSYQGMTQLYAAQAHPSALKAICPAMAAADLYSGWFYENRAFCLQVNLTWALQLGAETARRYHDESAFQRLRAAAQQPPFEHLPETLHNDLQRYAPFYFDWHNQTDPEGGYWRSRNPKLESIAPELPMLHVGGWFDPYLRGTLALYQKMQSTSTAAQLLLIGPWGHLPWGRYAGSKDFGPAAQNPIDALQLRWFDHWLKGIDTGLLNNPPVSVFAMGDNTWRSYAAWPPTASPTSFYLESNGLASTREDAGHLKRESPTGNDPIPDVLVHDPWRPVPSLGGHAALPAGVFERSHLDSRTDVLTYTTALLETPLHLCGSAALTLTVASSHPQFDLAATLAQITPEGQIENLTQGYGHYNAISQTIELALQDCCVVIPAGHQLRLSVSGASFPAYPVPLSHHRLDGNPLPAHVITLQVTSSAATPAQLQLPHIAMVAVPDTEVTGTSDP
ncbi:MAG: CocE/NonD family hydrolase [Spirulina sp. SIO3F2]|nr:CocE/NonD family hydrolase [Spirulina sp. SIO3F2]